MNKQLNILQYLGTVESATLSEIYSNVPIDYYCNYKKHLGAIMSRMVENGSVQRVKKGLFRLSRPLPPEEQLNIGIFKQ
jgi:hypothetical protein